MNLQIARRKKMMRRQRMQRLAEMRRLAKLESQGKEQEMKPETPAPSSSSKQKLPQNNHEYDMSKDYFLGERNETNNEKIVISLRLTSSLMKHLHDGKTTFTKYPASIRDIKTYPLFNKICKVQQLLTPQNGNPIFWSIDQVTTFIEQVVEQKAVSKRFEMHEIDGESLLNLTKSDLENYFDFDSNLATQIIDQCEQLRKETIMRFVNS